MSFGNYKGGSKPRTGKISDRALSRMLNIPLQTLNDWKKYENPENWRIQIYNLLKTMTEDEINERKD
jgi:hypothetical protein